jgi:hypothetical protein
MPFWRVDLVKRQIAASALMAVAVAACGSSSTGGGTPAATSSPTPSGPPTASGTTKGDTSVAGNIKFSSVSCNEPRVNGSAIRMFGQTAGQPANGLTLVISIQAQSVNVRAASGSGATYAQREFNGSGVSGFDAAKGAKVDSTLIEDKAAGANPSTIGAVTSLAMMVDCANQQPGSASLTVTGTASGGTLSGQLTSARVQCYSLQQGNSVGVTALAQVGGKPDLIIVSVYWMGITAANNAHFYINNDPSSGTATTTGGHWNGDVTEQATGAKLHISGEATCGSSVNT